MANSKISALTSATTPLAGTETLPVVQSGTTKQVSVANFTAGRPVATGNLTATGNMSYTVNTANADGLTGTNSNNGAYFTLQVGGSSGFGVSNWANSTILESVPASTGGLVLGSYTGKTYFQIGRFSYMDLSSSALTFTAINLTQGTAAKGVNFTANTPASGMTSQLLNWYEEGTFTPTWTPASGSGYTVNNAVGWYQRIGNRVFFDITISTNGHGTAAGNVTIGGLPFLSSANANQFGGAYCTEAANAGFAGAYTPVLRVNYNATTLTPNVFSATTGTTQMTAAVWGVSGYYRFTGSYQAA